MLSGLDGPTRTLVEESGLMNIFFVIPRPEQRNSFVCKPMRFESLEDSLTVMQGADRGWYFERPVGHDARFFPVLVPVFSTKHVIAEDRSERKFSEVNPG